MSGEGSLYMVIETIDAEFLFFCFFSTSNSYCLLDAYNMGCDVDFLYGKSRSVFR